ncbi:MAG: fructose-bisphosphate aldolase [Candidatus Odinarchaeota archaeon]|nr:fructose-bisphosphate aldolase [Candidatus Odinarchaeota archaeon]
MIAGKIIRMGRILRKSSGNTVIVAMDHGGFAGPMDGIIKPGETIKKVIEGGADAMLLNPGIVEKFADVIAGQISVILRSDVGGTIFKPTEQRQSSIMASIDTAIKLGADAIITMGYFGSEYEVQNMAVLSEFIEAAREYGLIAVTEAWPSGPKVGDPKKNAKAIAVSARVAAEIGADMIKTFYTGDKESFKQVTEGCPVPIVILGGPKRPSLEETLQDIRDAIDAGAHGVAFGRNVWQAKDPVKMTQAIVKIVHENASVKEAMEIINS